MNDTFLQILHSPFAGLSGRAIYSTFALVYHIYIGNARFGVDSNQHIREEAKQDIQEGEEITVQYYR